MRLIKLFLFLLPSVYSTQTVMAQAGKSSFLVCYGRLDPTSVKGYKLVILEAAHYKKDEIRLMRQNNDHVLAYISLGEVNEAAPHYKALKESTLGKNQTWNSHYLDLSKPATHEVLMGLLQKGFDNGFDGFFIDNLDNFGSFGPQKEQRHEFLDFLSKIRSKWPEKYFVQNAGIEMIDQTAGLMNGVIVESVATDYNFTHKMYRLRQPEKAFAQYADKLRQLKEQHNIPVMLIEYAHSEKLKNQVQARLEPYRLDYFIANIDLQTLPKFKP
jgi:uncharacterized protein (TIGR01370 family)